MTISDEIIHYEAEVTRLKEEIAEQGRYKGLKAQGMFGSESNFTDMKVLQASLREAKQHLMTLQGTL